MDSYIRQKLMTMQEKEYADFSGSLVPGAEPMLGVRLPKLRALAKELAGSVGEKALSGEDDRYFEEKLLRGMIIGYLKTEPSRRLELIREFVPRINNWSVCDSFCCTLKLPSAQKETLWELLVQYAASDKEFEQRFAAVMLLRNFVKNDVKRSLELLASINTEAYYSSMGVAWALAECFIYHPDETMPYFERHSFDILTHNRAVSKLRDSFRITPEQKAGLDRLKR